ncbi:MAG: type II/IV secretion system protein [Kiritimatiellae bacterium]|nr:type II/IV secretion system protein [Kiritimatiellia bacterium]
MNEEPLDLSTVTPDPACILAIPPSLALRRLALPLCVLNGELVVAMADPADTQTIEAIARACGHPVQPRRAETAQLRESLLRFYGDSRPRATADTAAEDPVALVDHLLRTALLRHASDIHFDPEPDSLRVRFRVDGELEEIRRIPAAMQPSVTSRLKVLAGLDIAERRAAQDGAFTWRMQGIHTGRIPPLDIRMATLPVRHGERITLRLLEHSGERLTLDRLGLSDSDLANFERVLSKPHGLVLLTGPTGSGKTTTLYAAIQLLLAKRPLNILTVEDPVEYEIPGVSQAEVDSADKVNFSKALRSLLRHDPDVIMIGEIRDSESLDTAVKAALTGHLVLSTLHTNDAISAVTRLTDMGLASHLAAATLRLSVAQRLVRALCPHCRQPYSLTAEEAVSLGHPDWTGKTFYRPGGCLRCAGRGFKGRIGIFEFFQPDRTLASRIATGAHESELYAYEREQGMKTLFDDAMEKCLEGKTAVSEIQQLIGGGF